MDDYTPTPVEVDKAVILKDRFSELMSLEIAKDWNEFVETIKNFRNHIWWAGIAVGGAGLFTMIYSIYKIPDNRDYIPLAITGGIITVLGAGIVVDQTAHLSYQ